MKPIQKGASTLSLCAIAALATPKSAYSQDFFNGYRGPRTTQLDVYASRTENNTTSTIIPKAFLGNLLLAAPSTIDRRVTNQGVNFGYIIDPDKGLGAIVATGLFRDGNDKYKVITPQIYVTEANEQVSVDLEAAFPVHLKEGLQPIHAAITAGKLVTERLRLGGTIGMEGKSTMWRAVARYELTTNHQYWAQLYAGKNANKEWTASARVAINMGK